MLLSDRDLHNHIETGQLRLDPFDPGLIQPSSIDVRLDRWFRVFNGHLHTHIDPLQEQPDLTTLVEVPDGQPFILHPGEFVLASTLEDVTVGDAIAARLEGKSSLGRLGLLVHSTAGFIDTGFSGQVTLELSNVANLPIRLWPGMKVGQLCVFRLSSPSEHPYGSAVYGSRYQGQRGPTASRYAQTLPAPAGTARCPRCGAVTVLDSVYAICLPCAAELGWNPRCEACIAEERGLIAKTPHVATCAPGRAAQRALWPGGRGAGPRHSAEQQAAGADA